MASSVRAPACVCSRQRSTASFRPASTPAQCFSRLLATQTQCRATAVRAQPAETAQPAPVKEKWWEKNPQPNLLEAHSFEEIAKVLSENDSSLVLLDFYAPWCNACKSLYPKLNKLCVTNPTIVIVKVNWMENKALAKTMGVKVLPYFMGFHGSMGKVAAFSSSITKIQRLYDCIELFGQPFCNIGGVDLQRSLPEFTEVPDDATRLDYKDGSKAKNGSAQEHAAQESAAQESAAKTTA